MRLLYCILAAISGVHKAEYCDNNNGWHRTCPTQKEQQNA